MIRDKGAEINNNNEKKKHTHIFFYVIKWPRCGGGSKN
jgi:hypothetical protein